MVAFGFVLLQHEETVALSMIPVSAVGDVDVHLFDVTGEDLSARAFGAIPVFGSVGFVVGIGVQIRRSAED